VRAHLSPRTISDLERGITTAPYRDTVGLLADALGLGGSERAALEHAVRRARSSSSTIYATGRPPVDQLLATKLAIPPARGNMLPRPRLVERLQAAMHGPLTLLSAPAGSGKSRLVSAWCLSPAVRDRPLAWVSLDEADNDPARFWRYVLTALDHAAPGVGGDALSLLRYSDASTLGAVLSALVNALAERAEDIALILDDYHLIEAAPIHRMVAFLLDHLPSCLHLLIATRADPPLPLARLRARGEMTELRAADLRFSVEETAAFLSTGMGLSISPGEIAALATRTEGWIAGLQLAGLSLQGRHGEEAATFVRAFTGSNRYIVDYLLDEVLLRQPEPVQRFLLYTCILDRLCAPLCAAVLGGENPSAAHVGASQELLESLERNNVFLIALDDERQWYRYHYLFADALRQRQSAAAAIPEVATLHRRAGAWFAQQDLLEEAVEHALAGGCHEMAADLIGRAARALSARGEMQTISTWLLALPQSTLRARPHLSLLYAWLLVDMRDVQGAEQYLRYAEEALETMSRGAAFDDNAIAGMRYPAGDVDDVRAAIEAGRAVVSVMRGDAVQAIRQARAALDGLGDAGVRARSIAGIALGLAYLSQGAAHEAAAAFGDVAAGNHTTSYVLFLLLAAVGEACARRMAGDLDLAGATYDQAIVWSVEHAHPTLLVGSLYAGQADILRERHRLDAALDHATLGIKLSTERGAAQAERWIEWHVCDLLVLARIKQAQGNLTGALTILQQARHLLQGFGASAFAAILAAFEAQLHVAAGDLAAALRWLRSTEVHDVRPRFGLTPQYFAYAAEHLEVAPLQILIAQGRATGDRGPLRRALALLDELRARAERRDLAWLHSKSFALQALAHQALGEIAPALVSLDRALALARSEHYIQLFLDEGPPMAELLLGLRARGRAPDHLEAVLGALDSTPAERAPSVKGQFAGGPATHSLPGPLTDREIDVLRLIAAGRSNPEIGRALHVEVNTVKTHVKSLYSKLSVHGRVDAVRRARELGLL
jgi:LuxR family maltose regulon positive regulatory protein